MSSAGAAARMGAQGLVCILFVLGLLLGPAHEVVAADGAVVERVALGSQVHLGADAAAPSIPTFTLREIGAALLLLVLVVLLSVTLRNALRRDGRRHPY